MPVPDAIRHLIGEIANHLRSALNYLVGHLSVLDSGSEHELTQFPIMDTPEKFWNRRNSFLAGVTDVHVAAIECLQPYKECNWTHPLAEMSNVDKHSDPVVVKAVLNITGGETSVERIEGNARRLPSR